MRGLRTKEDPKFIEFFKLIQEEAAKMGKVFFAEAGDGRDIITDTLEGEDVSGWLIPTHLADKFEFLFRAYAADGDPQWEEYSVFAIWTLEEGEVRIHFEKYDINGRVW